MRGIIVTTDNTINIMDFKEPVIDTVGDTVGGTPETVWPRRLAAPYIMIVNGEGRLSGLPLNIFGSYLYAMDQHGDPIVGDILILRESGNDWAGLTGSDIYMLIDLTAQVLQGAVCDDVSKGTAISDPSSLTKQEEFLCYDFGILKK